MALRFNAAAAALALASAGTSSAVRFDPRRDVSSLLASAASREEILAATKVVLPGMNTSFAGFFNVNSTSNAYHFFWYWPAQNGASDAQTVAWFQGGPGGSSLFGMLTENGPFRLDATLNPVFNPYTWCMTYSCVFVDNPRNTGYSHADDYCTDSDCYGADGASFFQQFTQAFGITALWITAESYGGKYGPAIAAAVHNANKAGGQPQVPLKGIALGNGFSDPALMIQGYPDLMFNTGLIDDVEMAVAQSYVANASAALAAGDFVGAYNIWDEFLNGDTHPSAWFQVVTGLNDYFNFAERTTPDAFGYSGAYVVQPFVRTALGVGSVPYQDGNVQVEIALKADVMASQKSNIALLLDNGYTVAIYNGHLDIICGAPLTDRYVPTIPWSGASGYAASSKNIWHEPASNGTIVSGWVRQYKNLLRIIVKGAGHIAPWDQPARTQDMITRVIEGSAWN